MEILSFYSKIKLKFSGTLNTNVYSNIIFSEANLTSSDTIGEIKKSTLVLQKKIYKVRS